MKYRISVDLNRIPTNYNIADDFEKARLYHLKHKVDITFVFNNTDIHGYTSAHQTVPLDRWVLEGSQNLVTIDSTADANMFVFDQAEWANPPDSPFPLRPDTPTGNCFLFNSKPFINIGAYILDHNDGQLWIQIAHEIMHSLCFHSNLAGFPIQDVLDTYFHNDDPDYPGGNFAQDWVLLQAYINSKTLPVLRIGSSGEAVKILQTDLNKNGSTLVVDGSFGNKTKAAVIAFQTFHRLSADGIVGPMTWQAFDMIDIITSTCNTNGVEPLLGIAVASCESSLNPKAKLFNPPSNSTDRGLYQWNNVYHSEITDEMAYDSVIACRLFCEAVKAGYLHTNWSSSQPCWIKKLTPEIITKYGL